MRTTGRFDDVFLSIAKIGDYADIREYEYPNQIYIAACRFNQSRKRNSGRRLSVHSMNDEKGKFFRVFLIEKS